MLPKIERSWFYMHFESNATTTTKTPYLFGVFIFCLHFHSQNACDIGVGTVVATKNWNDQAEKKEPEFRIMQKQVESAPKWDCAQEIQYAMHMCNAPMLENVVHMSKNPEFLTMAQLK